MADAAPSTTTPSIPSAPPTGPRSGRRQRRLIAYILVAVILLAVVATTAIVLLSSKAPATTRSLRIGLTGQKASTLNPNSMTLTLECIVTSQPYAAIDSMLTAIPIFPKYLWSGIADPVASSPPVIVGSGTLYFDTNSNLASGPIILRRNPNFYGDAQYCSFSRPDEIR